MTTRPERRTRWGDPPAADTPRTVIPVRPRGATLRTTNRLLMAIVLLEAISLALRLYHGGVAVP